MNLEPLRVQLEKTIFAHLEKILQVETIQEIRKKIPVQDKNNYLSQMLEGHYFKVTDKVAAEKFKLFEIIKEKLGFTDKVEYYIASNPQINASTIPSITEDRPHIIILNSGLIEKFSFEELKFVIGHEFGHIIYRTAFLKDHMDYLFANKDGIHFNISLKIKLWEKLAELSADRIGLLVSDNITDCLTAFFKLSSGMSPESIPLNIEEYVKHIEEVFESFQKNFSAKEDVFSHPMIPIRIKLLDVFSKSQAYKTFKQTGSIIEDSELYEVSNDLAKILLKYGDSGIDLHRKVMIATAGILMSNVDSKMNEDEYENILGGLTQFDIFPEEFLGNLTQSENFDPMKYFVHAVEAILKNNPMEKNKILGYLFQIAIADNEIHKVEIEFLMMVAKKILGFTDNEANNIINSLIQTTFNPKPW